MPFDREQLAGKLKRLAAQGVMVGTSSWKYEGWFDSLYDRSRYVWHGRFSNARFERDCLAEYAQIFPTVSVDATYYKFPGRASLEKLAAQVTPDFRFAFKVTDDITIKRFANLPRFGIRAGRENPNFLNATLFTDAFLASCEAIWPHVGLIMFEFSRFGSDEFAHGSDFVDALGEFLAKLPKGWPYGVELRNRHWLRPDFAALAAHGVTHIFNAWADMPPVGEQLALPGHETNPSLLAARFLLSEGRRYEEAVKQFSPYNQLKVPNPAGRAAAAELVWSDRRPPGFLSLSSL